MAVIRDAGSGLAINLRGGTSRGGNSAGCGRGNLLDKQSDPSHCRRFHPTAPVVTPPLGGKVALPRARRGQDARAPRGELS